MMTVKKVISACIDQILQFNSEQEIDRYIGHLKKMKQVYQVVWKNTLDNGLVQLRIKKQYNQAEFLEEGGDTDEQKHVG